MKIGIDISQSVYQGTGVAKYTRNLVKALLNLNTNHEFILFGSTLRRQQDLKSFVNQLSHKSHFKSKIYNFPLTLLDVLWNRMHAVSIESLIGNVDVFHSSDWTEPRSSAPKVTTIHDVTVYKFPEEQNPKIIATQKRKLAWVKKESAAVIADSESTKKDIIEILKMPEEKIRVIYLGVEEQFKPQPLKTINEVKSKFGIKKEYILCVGTREPRKNLDRVIKAFKELNMKNYQLVIAGNAGWGKDIIPDKNVILAGFVNDLTLAALYSGAGCFVYPSLYEGFGLPILEAMACGAPVVTSNQGSLKELAGPAIIADPYDVESISTGIEETIKLSGTQRQKLTNTGIEHVSRFTWEKTARQTLEVYQSVA